jgi:predicted RNA binding protein YcfA (HicA-like mRNA interferase family)
MSQWDAVKAKRLLAALLRIGWTIKRESGSHRTLAREGWPDVVFAFHDSDEIGPKIGGACCEAHWTSPRRPIVGCLTAFAADGGVMERAEALASLVSTTRFCWIRRS